jgi:hypothetical protein
LERLEQQPEPASESQSELFSLLGIDFIPQKTRILVFVPNLRIFETNAQNRIAVVSSQLRVGDQWVKFRNQQRKNHSRNRNLVWKSDSSCIFCLESVRIEMCIESQGNIPNCFEISHRFPAKSSWPEVWDSLWLGGDCCIVFGFRYLWLDQESQWQNFGENPFFLLGSRRIFLSREESVWARSSRSPNWDGHGLNHNENKSESTEGEVENIFGHSISSFSRFWAQYRAEADLGVTRSLHLASNVDFKFKFKIQKEHNFNCILSRRRARRGFGHRSRVSRLCQRGADGGQEPH